MSTALPVTIADDSLTGAWARAFMHVWASPEPAPMVVSLQIPSSGVPTEDHVVRTTLDDALLRHNKVSTSENAELLFPWRSWQRRTEGGRHAFYAWYLDRMLPRLKASDRNNRFGTYFQRMIAYPSQNSSFNQLEHILELWNGRREHHTRPRESALEVAIFNPAADHTKAVMRGFPCLQQLSISYSHQGDGMALTALYPCQYIFDRGYGNYLGLCHLGRFMAQAMGQSLIRVTCLVVKPELGKPSKTALMELHRVVDSFLASRRVAA